MYKLDKIIRLRRGIQYKKQLIYGCIYWYFFPFIIYAQTPSSKQADSTNRRNSIYLKISANLKDIQALKKKEVPTVYQDIKKAEKAVKSFIQKLHQQAYLNAQLDSLLGTPDTLFAYISVGTRFIWASLKKGNLPEEIIHNVGFKPKYYNKKPFLYKSISKLQSKVLSYSENHGYPFAQIRLDSLTFIKQEVYAKWNYDQGPQILFDTLHIVGDLQVKPEFMMKYLRLREGDLFSQSKVQSAHRILKQLPYLKVRKKAVVDFRAKKASVNLFLRKRKANQINLLVGLLPNEQNPGTLEWMGEFDLLLQNMFRSGKSLSAKWLRPESQSQLINLDYTHPLLFGSALDLQLKFNLLKEDTSFVNIDLGGVLFYNLKTGDKIKVTVNSKSSRVLNSLIYQNATRLPDTLDISFIAYGLGYIHSNLNDALYPSKGDFLSLSGEIGQKKILQNPELPENLYKNIPLSTTKLVYKAKWKHYSKTSSKSVFYWQLSTGGVINDQLLVNELFRVGGINSLRGHNQNTFFASHYVIANLEYRFLFDDYSYLFVFYDQSWLQQKTINTFTEDTPLGFGLGLNFPTKAGIFNIVYALGKAREQPINFNRSKIHFGFISRF
ncbi:BamA/TamA family outer membrane protein [uncultured Microscilla sp.]|uniref:BamA/TamA family outer membrane protein n=1 Tax=uncultured Microscilla sp. TaxID=432653 RepID=UPI00262AC687|nr:BamA/TamA family outer membrane protein [uncultured Microscilla sp.]